MKKVLFLLALSFVITQAQAQTLENPIDTIEHLKFMGIPINGNADEFANKLVKEKGLVRVDDYQDEYPTLIGKFAGYDNCMIIINTNKGNAVSLAVAFPFQESWDLLYGNYSNLKKNLTTKYGEPECTEQFDTMFEPTDDYDRMHQARMGRCKYESSFYTKEGKIVLMISNSQTKCSINLMYLDRVNVRESNKNDMDDL